jgi:hypothetical protein
MIQIGAIVGEIWRIGSEMWGSRRGQLDVCPETCFQAQVSPEQELPVGPKLHWGPPYSPRHSFGCGWQHLQHPHSGAFQKTWS